MSLDDDTTEAAGCSAPAPTFPPPTRAQVMMALAGTLLGIVLAALASTTILTSLPVMMSDLGAGQTAYTWVVTSTLLTTTISLAVWGKLADLYSHKRLMHAAIGLFVLASLCAGLSPTAEILIGFRALQGVGAGGLIAVGPVLIADLLSPRERGRYAGLISGVIGVGTMGGPVLGGLITDSIGWRWNFYLGIPFAIAAVLLLERSVHLPPKTRPARIDWLGATLISAATSVLLVWVTVAGQQFAWASWPSAAMGAAFAALLILVILVERSVPEPIIPLALMRDASILRVVIAGVALGITMIAVPTFMSQYFQIARGLSASASGMLMLSTSVATFVTATVVGQSISRTGRWKLWVVLGGAALAAGLGGLATITVGSSLITVSGYLLCIGFAVGILMQNLLVISQNCAPPEHLGAASALPAFFRQLAGTVSISVLGAVLTARLLTFQASTGVAHTDEPGTAVPRAADLEEPLRGLVQEQYADIIADLFLLCVPLAVIGLVAILTLPNIPFSTQTAVERHANTDG
ncbi:MFS transporter [Tomitella biformata]|uniref:MFS transporter n=1 Tax=Tomitella biformata TaxID=630403 RepID=UPI00056FD058|nr:MFS transporter [Tomitella biformata]